MTQMIVVIAIVAVVAAVALWRAVLWLRKPPSCCGGREGCDTSGACGGCPLLQSGKCGKRTSEDKCEKKSAN
ncbi:MAG: hypothetical protein HUK12_02565 [Muribaculaceae bacterium]|nr:hypothetical protein [Muribaculaceae bacterium]